MRVTSDHWNIIIQFAELHPQIITNKFISPMHGKRNLKDLWEELSVKLNSLGHGTRSVEEWKKCLADWKSKTKTKCTKINIYSNKTGGGPAYTGALSNLEERLLSLMGKTAIDGDDVPEKGKLKYISLIPTF